MTLNQILNESKVALIDYKNDDLFFDLEIRGNIFVDTHYYPKQDKLVISFLESLEPKTIQVETKTNIPSQNITNNPIIDNQHQPLFASKPAKQVQTQISTEWTHGFLQNWYIKDENNWCVKSNEESINLITNQIRKRVTKFKDTTIEFENLATLKGFLSFAKRYGITNFSNKTRNQWNWKFIDHQTRKKYIEFGYGIPFDTDDNFDANKYGLRIGYNSIKYDQTMIAYMLGLIGRNIITQQIRVLNAKTTEQKQIAQQKLNNLFYTTVIDVTNDGSNKLSPSTLVNFNNQMFSNNHQMTKALHELNHDVATHRAWTKSNRYLDIMSLNPKRLALKRGAMSLGYKIEESDTNRDPTAKIEKFDELVDLIVYNANDVYVSKKIFEHPPYQNRFDQNNQLLKEFPYLTYEQDTTKKSKLSYKEPSEANVRDDRLTINSTSTQLVESIIAPYDNTKIKDAPKMTLDFPGAFTAKKLNEEHKLPAWFKGKPRSALDYVEYLLHDDLKHVDQITATKVWNEFSKIKKFYETKFINKNFNKDIATNDNPYVDPKTIPDKKIDIRYITPKPYYHNNNPKLEIASYVTLALGGVHGIEIVISEYQKDLKEYEEQDILIQETINWLNELDDSNLEKPVTKDNFLQNIGLLYSTKGENQKYLPFSKVKELELPFAPSHKLGDLFTKNSSRKKVKIRTITKPSLYGSDGRLKDKYAYTSSGIANHEDFDSYYPSLISLLDIFLNADNEDVYTNKLYHPRLRFKNLANDSSISFTQRAHYALRQLSMKLMINAASGGADVIYSSKIKANNKIVAMRIIGQIFCWYIGQSLALHNARIPSSNTDGLYSMNIEPEINDKIVKDCANKLLLKIDPEIINIFHSKDANNRFETDPKHPDEIGSAKGGSLTSWKGPSTDNNLAHPAIIDRVLAQYLLHKKDPINNEFDETQAKKEFIDFIKTQEPTEIMRFFQFPFTSSPNKGRIIFKYFDENHYEVLNNINRGYLVKESASDYTLKMTKLQVVSPATIKKRLKAEHKTINDHPNFADIININPVADNILEQLMYPQDYKKLYNGEYNKHATTSEDKPRDITIGKITDLPENQKIILYNDDLHEITDEFVKDFVKNKLDLNSYLQIVKEKFKTQWQNKNTINIQQTV